MKTSHRHCEHREAVHAPWIATALKRLAMTTLLLLLVTGCTKLPEAKPTYIQAEKLFEKQDFIGSATMLSKLLDNEPKLPKARNLLARCFFFLGNPDRSIEELSLVLNYAPVASDESLDALFLLGAVSLEAPQLSEKNRTKGQKAWEFYLKVAPKSQLKDQVTQGLAEMRALKNPAKATELARSYVQKYQPGKALSIFGRITRSNPNYLPAWHYQGMAHIMSGNPKAAVQSWQEVLRKDPVYAKKFKLDERIRVAESL
jgi:tetratricopeptide (TPR) repeat protein